MLILFLIIVRSGTGYSKEIRPHETSPFITFLLRTKIFYIAYVSEQNLLIDKSNRQCSHLILENFSNFNGEKYIPHIRAGN